MIFRFIFGPNGEEIEKMEENRPPLKLKNNGGLYLLFFLRLTVWSQMTPRLLKYHWLSEFSFISIISLIKKI